MKFYKLSANLKNIRESEKYPHIKKNEGNQKFRNPFKT